MCVCLCVVCTHKGAYSLGLMGAHIHVYVWKEKVSTRCHSSGASYLAL